jgi:mitochondrial fission protein ELM1
MVGDSSGDISNEMRSLAALGFRVKSGWAAAVLVKDSAHLPRLCDVQRIDLSDPRLPETRQPYHATMGRLETDMKKISRRVDVVRRITKKSIAKLLADYRQQNFTIKRAALVVGSQIDPRSVANAHIRAHALEGQLFRSVLQQSLHRHGIRTEVLLEREVYGKAAVELKQSNENVRRMIQNFGREAKAPWRAEQKLAAIAAWSALH